MSFIVARQLKRISVLLGHRLCNNGMKYTQNDLLSSLREAYISRKELDQILIPVVLQKTKEAPKDIQLSIDKCLSDR